MPEAKSLQHEAPSDPKAKGPKPEYPQKKMDPPGSDAKMTPKADHGEESYTGLGRLKDRVALITGGDSGIGRAVALAFAREGANVLISYLPAEEQDAKASAHWVEQAGRKAILAPGDICSEQHCASLIDRAFDEFGKLDILVNNAAYQRTHESIEEFTTEEFDATFRTNVYAMFWLCRAALPRMKAGSCIINTASIQAFDPSPTLLAYAPTKAAIVSFTKALSQTHPVDDARRHGQEVRAGHGVRPRRAARRARAAVRVPRLERGALRDRRGLRRDGRQVPLLVHCAPCGSSCSRR
jgi:NAD(P)-dependent dehydrogenase (short-subunit alcohol dehydrogenase family)